MNRCVVARLFNSTQDDLTREIEKRKRVQERESKIAAVLRMRAEGLKVAQISAQTGVPYSTVKKYLAAAK
jgi:DNA-binding NarL/FixJ family response regulator